MKKTIALVLAVSCLLVAGCAATLKRPVAPSEALGIPTSAASKIYLLVQAPPEIAKSEDWELFRTEWRTAMAATTSAASREFAYLESMPESFDGQGTLVVVDVSDYRYLSPGARYGFGIMTGNAYIEADADFYVLPDKRLAGNREYKTSSTAWQGIFSAMTNKQVAAITEQMLQEIDAR